VTIAPPALTPEHHATLLAIARRAVRDGVQGAATPGPISTDPTLQAPAGAFVTITREGQLRGCIGYVEPVKPLAEAVASCAASAATADPRFPPVTPEDLPHLRIEISVLSPLIPIDDPQGVQVGRHGLFISHRGRHGLLLPQVATEFAWDRETFLRQACVKAGLPGDAWQHGAEIKVFTVDHFTDDVPIGLAEP
jgi:AmmeMemoRadiSam system protein A